MSVLRKDLLLNKSLRKEPKNRPQPGKLGGLPARRPPPVIRRYALSLNDIFGYSYGGGIGRRANFRLAEIYRVTVDKMLDVLRSGMLIHGDETKINIKESIAVTSGRSRARRASFTSIIRPGKGPFSRRRLETSLASSCRTLRCL